MNRPLTIICMFRCGHKIIGTFASDLHGLMKEHYRIVHAADIDAILKGGTR